MLNLYRVRVATHSKTEEKFAIKVMAKQKLVEQRSIDSVFREIAIMVLTGDFVDVFNVL